MKKIGFSVLKFLSRLKNKIISIAISKIVITFASVFTVTNVLAAGTSRTSLVPDRPLSPQLPSKTACQIVKSNQTISTTHLSQKYEMKKS